MVAADDPVPNGTLIAKFDELFPTATPSTHT
jgi:hypothetical protein